MKTTVIATEGSGIQVEVKADLIKEFVEKMEKNLKKVKEFVANIDIKVSILLQKRTLILGTMLNDVVDFETISKTSSKLGDIMLKTTNFIRDLPEEEQVKTPVEENKTEAKDAALRIPVSEAVNDAFESLKKSIPDCGIFMMVADPKAFDVHVIGNLDKNFVISTLLMNG